MDLQLSSPAFAAGALIPTENSCRGSDTSPELVWGEPPAGSQSFALIMDDPDAPSGTFVHWVIFNIPASARGLPASLPRDAKLADGTVQGRMGGRDLGYHGPCPPSGTHRYFFKLYALDTLLDLTSDARAQDLTKAMEGHILAKGELMGLFKR
jgi:Raf kinase inhibitor-like YbhB/YbcL family protein